MDVSCILIDHFPVKAELQRNRDLVGRPIVLARSNDPRTPIVDFSTEAGDLVIGMPLRDALSRCTNAMLLEPDLPYYQRVFDRILEALEQRSPVVEDAGLGRSYVNIRGLSSLYAGEIGIAQALFNAVPDNFEAKLSLANGKFPAYVAAINATPGRAVHIPDNPQQFLSGFPVDILPVAWKMKVALHEFGLHCLGQVASLPLQPLQTQFGKAGELAWKLANGIDKTPLAPRRAEETVTEEVSYPDPTVNIGPLLLGIEVLLSKVFSNPMMDNRHTRGVIIKAEISRSVPWVKRVSFREPIGNNKRALSIITNAITSSMPLSGPVEAMALTVWGLTGEVGIQQNIFPEVRRRDQIRECLKQLEARLGMKPPVYQVREVEPWSRIPERRRALVQLSP